MAYVGLDPQAAGELAMRLDQAAADLEGHAGEVARLLDQAGIVSSAAPAQLREIAGWAAYRSRDLRRRIDKALAADSGAAGARAPGFRFASRGGAKKAGTEEADKIRALLDGHHPKKLAEDWPRRSPTSPTRTSQPAFSRAWVRKPPSTCSARPGARSC